jgi:3-keto-L-gulonate-6-phosphate decarboxylase
MNKIIKLLDENRLLKVISGITNYDLNKVRKIVHSAQIAGADLVDICDDENIIKEMKNCFDINLCVSSIDINKLKNADLLGVAMIELGNYEALHDQGIFYSAQEVLQMAKEIMAFNPKALVSITVPGHLEVKDQVELAEKLELLGVDLIQTEGASLVDTKAAAALGQIEKVKLTLANTIEISKVLNNTFLMTASGITPDTAKLAIACGANGIGVGQYINKLNSEIEMIAATRALIEAIDVKAPITINI